MAFNLRNFVMKTLEKMRESEDEYQVRVYALKWYTKGVLTDEDMATIEAWYEVKDIEVVVHLRRQQKKTLRSETSHDKTAQG